MARGVLGVSWGGPGLPQGRPRHQKHQKMEPKSFENYVNLYKNSVGNNNDNNNNNDDDDDYNNDNNDKITTEPRLLAKVGALAPTVARFPGFYCSGAGL